MNNNTQRSVEKIGEEITNKICGEYSLSSWTQQTRNSLKAYISEALQLHGEEMYKKGADENKTADSYFERLKSETRRKAIEEAANIIKTWHISKGGFGELEFQVRKLLEVKP